MTDQPARPATVRDAAVAVVAVLNTHQRTDLPDHPPPYEACTCGEWETGALMSRDWPFHIADVLLEGGLLAGTAAAAAGAPGTGQDRVLVTQVIDGLVDLWAATSPESRGMLRLPEHGPIADALDRLAASGPGSSGDTGPAAAPEPPVRYLASPCDTCGHAYNHHASTGVCEHRIVRGVAEELCVCARFVDLPALDRESQPAPEVAPEWSGSGHTPDVGSGTPAKIAEQR